jgi:hypothetical protein
VLFDCRRGASHSCETAIEERASVMAENRLKLMAIELRLDPKPQVAIRLEPAGSIQQSLREATIQVTGSVAEMLIVSVLSPFGRSAGICSPVTI